MAAPQSCLPNNFQLTGEVGLISDFNFLEQYFEREYDQLKDQTTDFELKQYRDNSTWSVVGSVRLNPFFTETEWLPRVDHFWIGQPLLGDRLDLVRTHEPGVSPGSRAPQRRPIRHKPRCGVRCRGKSRPPARARANGWPRGTRSTCRSSWARSSSILTCLGELARWGENLDFDPENRAYGAAGIRAQHLDVGSRPAW